jgi:hypothetical protein
MFAVVDCVIHNDQEGLAKLSTWMKEFEQAHSKSDIVFGIELTDTTGSRWRRIQVVWPETSWLTVRRT